MSTMQDIPSLLDLPEDVIYEILRFLDATTLYLLAKTCNQLDEIVRSHIALWRHIDARRAPNDQDKVVYCLDRCYDATHTFLIRGCTQSVRLAPIFLPKIGQFSKLAILACESQILDGTKYNVTIFPSQLIEFSLKKTIVTMSLEFFKGSGDHFKQLRVLILDQCDWLSSVAFMPISKYPSLEILSVYKCHNVENSIAYLTLSGQGFKTLKIFDARLSPLGNTLIRAIHRIQSLLSIYLQNEDISYKIDYMRRRLQILQGAPVRDFLSNDNEFDLSKLTNDENHSNQDNAYCDDDGFIDYLSVQSEVKNLKYPQSILYVDPYTSCSCGYDDHKPPRQHYSTDPADDSDDDDDDDHHDDESQIERLTRYLKVCSKFTARRPYFKRGIRRPQINPTAGLAPHPIYDVHNNEAARNHLDAQQEIPDAIDINNSLEESFKSVFKLFIFPRGMSGSGSSSEDDSPEPPRKKPRMEEGLAGPSGFNMSDSDTDEEMGGPRPPTPHPDVDVDNSNERSASYRIYFRDSPIVQIENINDTQKDIKVPLRRLSLRGYKKITNAALRYISDLDLDVLDVTYTSITTEAILNYLTSHPLCRVVHEKFCTCLPIMHF